MAETLKCPGCGQEVWDGPHGHKLAKCWGCGLAFDTMDDDDPDDALYAHYVAMTGGDESGFALYRRLTD